MVDVHDVNMGFHGTCSWAVAKDPLVASLPWGKQS